MLTISLDKTDAVNAALALVNGRSRTHTYTSVSDLRLEAIMAERELENLNVPKSARVGAVYVAQSGSRLPSAYKYAATVTVVYLIRKTKGWYLSEVRASTLHPRAQPRKRVLLTPAQDAVAVSALRRRYELTL